LKEQLYEAMFLIDSAKGGSGFPDTIRHISQLLTRQDARIEQIEKWDERKLAYRIRGVERGIYILTFFHMQPNRVAELRRAVSLSEEILRVLILRAEEVSEPAGELFTPEGEQAPAEPEAQETPVGTEGEEAEQNQ
jgi:small subunit ribosomal protein S6